ncbi:MAG: hypothetical protein ACK5O7_04900 [Holosporales bacterium]
MLSMPLESVAKTLFWVLQCLLSIRCHFGIGGKTMARQLKVKASEITATSTATAKDSIVMTKFPSQPTQLKSRISHSHKSHASATLGAVTIKK